MGRQVPRGMQSGVSVAPALQVREHTLTVHCSSAMANALCPHGSGPALPQGGPQEGPAVSRQVLTDHVKRQCFPQRKKEGTKDRNLRVLLKEHFRQLPTLFFSYKGTGTCPDTLIFSGCSLSFT